MREITFEVSGPFACFTKPEFSERMSYPIITPSAARNLTESIFWKPAIQWEIVRIRLLKPIQFITVKRNEINSYARKTPIDVTKTKNRTQRVSVLLKDVSYEITVRALMLDKGQDAEKFSSILERRIRKGQHFAMPYLGCREFTAFVKPSENASAVPLSADFGQMLFDQRYPKDDKETPEYFLFSAQMERGVINVPSRKEIMGV